jgi:hypothetical protein
MVNILALLQAAQGAQGSPTMMGPVGAQNPTPGFHAPALMAMRAPQQQPQANPLGQIGGMLGMMGPRMGTGDTTPGAGTTPIPGMSPIAPGTGPGGMMSTSAMDAAQNPALMQSQAGGGIMNWLRGLF